MYICIYTYIYIYIYTLCIYKYTSMYILCTYIHIDIYTSCTYTYIAMISDWLAAGAPGVTHENIKTWKYHKHINSQPIIP